MFLLHMVPARGRGLTYIHETNTWPVKKPFITSQLGTATFRSEVDALRAPSEKKTRQNSKPVVHEPETRNRMRNNASDCVRSRPTAS